MMNDDNHDSDDGDDDDNTQIRTESPPGHRPA